MVEIFGAQTSVLHSEELIYFSASKQSAAPFSGFPRATGLGRPGLVQCRNPWGSEKEWGFKNPEVRLACVVPVCTNMTAESLGMDPLIHKILVSGSFYAL